MIDFETFSEEAQLQVKTIQSWDSSSSKSQPVVNPCVRII